MNHPLVFAAGDGSAHAFERGSTFAKIVTARRETPYAFSP
jgi:hypothetical protein